MRNLAILALIAAPGLASAEIVPNDGTWTVKSGDVAVGDACPEELTPALEQMGEQMTQETTTEIVWNGTFDPTQTAIGGDGQGVTWTQVDDETWDGVINLPQDGGQLGTVRMMITAPDAIESEVTMSIGTLMAAQGQEIPGLETCEMTVASQMTHGG